MHTTTEPEPLTTGHGAKPDTRWRVHVLTAADQADCGRVVDLPRGGLTFGRMEPADVAFPTDATMSRQHVRLTPESGRVRVEDDGSKNGTWIDNERVTLAHLGDGGVLRIGQALLVIDAGVAEDQLTATPTQEIPGRSARARALREALAATADHDRPVLLLGATGTGKEHAAMAVHLASKRTGPMIRVNVASIPHMLFESELFGHVRGAFSGATADRLGRLREADRGTLMLDEIAELPLDVQAKLLRVLEERVVRPVGANHDKAVEVRIVAATHAHLEQRVAAGQFRRDLYARLAMDLVRLPDLRDRPADLPALADAIHPLPEREGGWAMALDAQAWARLCAQPWPENLRGFAALLLRLRRKLQRGRRLTQQIVETAIQAGAHPTQNLAEMDLRRGSRWKTESPDAEKLKASLARHHGNVSAVATELGRDRRQVYRWLQKFGLGRETV